MSTRREVRRRVLSAFRAGIPVAALAGALATTTDKVFDMLAEAVRERRKTN